MSMMADIFNALRSVMLLREEVRQLTDTVRSQNERIAHTARELVAVDKRVVRLEALVEFTARSAGRAPPILPE